MLDQRIDGLFPQLGASLDELHLIHHRGGRCSLSSSLRSPSKFTVHPGNHHPGMDSPPPVRSSFQPIGGGTSGPHLAGGHLSHALERRLWNWLDNQYHLCPFLDPAAI